MMREILHIIHKQIIEITAGNIEDAREIENRYKEFVKQINSPDFEKCFEGLLSPDQHLIIEKLEINLGQFSKQGLFHEFGHQLSVALRSALTKHLSNSASGHSIDVVKSIDTESENSAHKLSDISSQVKTHFEIVLFFLEKGRLPAWLPLDYELGEEGLIKTTDLQLMALRQIIQRSEQALLRLTSSFSVPFVAKIFLSIDSKSFDSRRSTYRHWHWIDTNLLTTTSEKGLFKKYYWSYALSNILNGRSIADESTDKETEVLSKTLKRLPYALRISMKERCEGKTISATLKQHLKSSLDAFGSTGESATKTRLYKSLSPFESSALAGKAGEASDIINSTNPDNFAEVLKKKSRVFKEEILNNDGAVGVNDAGLVLLSPFLKELFMDCGFLEEGIFISAEMSARAVNLLVYLANGTEDLPEYRKVLPKLLCGVLWETVLLEPSPLLELEKSKADDLLIAVVSHWKALRTSSPEALQEAFIRRHGKMINGNPGIILEVERKAQDILLNRLPWSYSIIRFPWMPEMLSVRWE